MAIASTRIKSLKVILTNLSISLGVPLCGGREFRIEELSQLCLTPSQEFRLSIKGKELSLLASRKSFPHDTPLKSGNLFKQGLNAQIWPPEARTQYLTLPPNTLQPQLAIAGKSASDTLRVQVASQMLPGSGVEKQFYIFRTIP